MDEPVLQVKEQTFIDITGVGLVIIDEDLAKILEEVRVKNIKESIFAVLEVLQKPSFLLGGLDLVPIQRVILVRCSFPFR